MDILSSEGLLTVAGIIIAFVLLAATISFASDMLKTACIKDTHKSISDFIEIISNGKMKEGEATISLRADCTKALAIVPNTAAFKNIKDCEYKDMSGTYFVSFHKEKSTFSTIGDLANFRIKDLLDAYRHGKDWCSFLDKEMNAPSKSLEKGSVYVSATQSMIIIMPEKGKEDFCIKYRMFEGDNGENNAFEIRGIEESACSG